MSDAADEPQVPDYIAEEKLITERDEFGKRAFQDVTRIVVIHRGAGGEPKYTEYWADAWQVSVQDNGRTVKLISRGSGEEAIKARAAGLGEALGISAEAAAQFTQAVAKADGQPDRYKTRTDLEKSRINVIEAHMSVELISFASAIRSQISKAHRQVNLKTEDEVRLNQLSSVMANSVIGHIASSVPAAQWHEACFTEWQAIAAESALIVAPYYVGGPLTMEQTPVGWLGEVPGALEQLREMYLQERRRAL
ncbi:hypothetical protein BKG82_26730 [Mycobacteroides chelonae]|uniref:Uncharacterized protein n=1 Tax=Mycobacteroides chelonae TaxID=1774 RepID=A0A1S1LC85_MYCCH|nr:hypothetical protein [Mycobacteroides chelonae]OHU47253.1 hypothetical protein BKG82_26730 [Mycobacteroides chelonae]